MLAATAVQGENPAISAPAATQAPLVFNKGGGFIICLWGHKVHKALAIKYTLAHRV